MSDESAVEAWLEHPGTMRDIDFVMRYFTPPPTAFQAAQFVMSVHMLAAMEMYGSDDVPEDPEPLFPDEADDEPWKRP